jgi:tripartite-type tricarboxylate transporter receptor subunit TctC
MSATKAASLAIHAVVLLALLRAVPGLAAAPDDYPSRVVKVIVPFAPGPAAADILPRLVAAKLAARFGTPFVIEHRAGAGGNIGAELVAKADPDGYTLLATPQGALVSNQDFYRKLGYAPEAFVPVTVLATLPNVLVVDPKLPFATFADFIAYAKAHPDKLTYASPGNGTSPYLAMEWLKHLAGIEMTHVPYAGIPPILKDLLAGTVDVTFANIFTVLPLVRSGQLRALAVDSPQRVAELPDQPAVAEVFPGYAVTTWFAVVAPPKTPPEIAAKLSAAIAAALKEPDVAEKLRALSAVPVGGSPAETAAFIAAERARLHEAFVASGLQAQ